MNCKRNILYPILCLGFCFLLNACNKNLESKIKLIQQIDLISDHQFSKKTPSVKTENKQTKKVNTHTLSPFNMKEDSSYLIKLTTDVSAFKSIATPVEDWFGISLEVVLENNEKYEIPVGIHKNGGLFIEDLSNELEISKILNGLNDGIEMQIELKKDEKWTNISLMIKNKKQTVLEHIAKNVIIPGNTIQPRLVCLINGKQKIKGMSTFKSYQLFEKK